MKNILQKSLWEVKKIILKITGSYSHSGERVCPAIPDDNFQAHLRVYQFMAQFVKGKSVLDVGCGTGYGADYLRRQGAFSVWGIDYSEEAISFARKHYKDHALDYRCMNAESIKFPNASFDVVTSSENLEHLPHPVKNMSEIRRVLKKGGILLLGTPNKEVSSPGQEKSPNPFHIKEFTYEELESLLKKHFRNVHIFENTLESQISQGRKMKAERRKRGKVGIEAQGKSSIRVGQLQVDLTNLKNTHSFMVIAW